MGRGTAKSGGVATADGAPGFDEILPRESCRGAVVLKRGRLGGGGHHTGDNCRSRRVRWAAATPPPPPPRPAPGSMSEEGRAQQSGLHSRT